MSINGSFFPGKVLTVALSSTLPQPLQYNGLTSVSFDSSQVWWIKTTTYGCVIRLEDPSSPNSGIVEVFSTTAAATVASDGGHFVSCTPTGDLLPLDYPSTAFYFNAALFQGIEEVSTDVYLNLGTESANVRVQISESASAMQAAINAATIPNSVNSVNLVAAGTTQGDATLATVNAGETTIFAVSGATTAATAAGVVLSAETTVGTKAIFYNSSANFFLQVYPASGGTIDNLAPNAPFAIPPLSSVEFTLGAANIWESSVVQSGQSVTASGTGVTGDATQFLVSAGRLNIVNIRSASNATNGIRLVSTLTNFDGTSILFVNASTTAYAQAFPPTGSNFGLGNDIALPIPPNASVLMVLLPVNGWKAVYGFNTATQSGTASTTQTQAAGTQIFASAVNATTVANSADAFTISRNLRSFTMTNSGANYAQVFPPVGGTIDAGAANAACRVYPDSTLLFTSNDGLAWKLSGTRVASATLVAGAATIDDGNIRATSNVNIQRLAVLGTIVSVHLLPTITAVTNVVVQSQTIAAANDATDVSTIRVTINY